jgi:hypothetical protein
MKKIIKVQPISEIELEFDNEKSLYIRFDMEALLRFDDIPGGLTSFIADTSVAERCAKVIYIGAVNSNPGFTLEKAREIVVNMDPNSVMEVLIEFGNSMGTTNNEMIKELQKKTMMEFLAKQK